MNEEKQIDMIQELLIDFDEMGFAPTTLCPNPEAYAIKWRKKLTEELKGYRKASEVALEVIGEVEELANKHISVLNALQLIDSGVITGGKHAFELVLNLLAELKKKYTEERDGTNN